MLFVSISLIIFFMAESASSKMKRTCGLIGYPSGISRVVLDRARFRFGDVTESFVDYNTTLRSVHFGVVVVELINCKCGGIVRKEIW